ncbi:MAG: hypothetical protein JNM17_20750 [Archangium sp.]|nr:hypothetical protein [Archangium sp.]
MTDEVDITAPNLPKVGDKKPAGADGTLETTEPGRRPAGSDSLPETTDTSTPIPHPTTSPQGALIRARIASITADQTSEPSLPKVAETASILEPVPEPANTLDLDEEAEAIRSADESAGGTAEKAKRVAEKAKKVELVPDPASQQVATKQRRAVPRALGGDGFEGASLQKLPEVKPAENQTEKLIELAKQSAFWIVLALIAAILFAMGAWFFS